jgi:hypothetical protein
MKLVAFSAALLAVTAAPAFAQTAAPATTPAPAAPAADATATAKFSLDTPIETIVADPAGKAVLDADFPGMTSHAMYDSFKGMSLTALQPMSQGQITDAQLAKAKADLAALK